MKKNENNSIESFGLMTVRFFNGIKNSAKKFLKKSLGKVGLFLIFCIIFININIGMRNMCAERNFFLEITILETVAADDMGSALLETYDASGTGMDPMNKEGVNNDLKASIGDPIGGFISTLLYGVLNILAKLVLFAGFLMDATLSQNFFRGLVDNQGVYAGWVIVRDTLNLFFMLLLLFSAFATIFQVEKYHLRKMIIMLVVMALLVNFSFPITRFIIDFSNSAMYFLVDSASTQSPSANFGRFSEMGKALATASELGVNTISSIILSIILTFIVLMTLLGFAINLLIRLLAFVILIILSPAGFALAFFPSTKNIADDWWSALFKYAFMGPTMMFFFYLAILMFDRAGSAASGEEAWVISFVKFFVPTVFLWIGLIASQKFGGSGSAMAMNLAKKTGNNIKSYGQKAAWGTVGIAGKGADSLLGNVPSGAWNATKNRFKQASDSYKDRTESRAAKIGGFMGVKDAMSNLERKNYEEDAKKMKSFNNNDLESKAKSGNVAAAEELLNRKALKEDVFREAIDKSKNDKRNADLTAKYKGANKDSRIDIVASIDARKNAADETKITETMAAHSLTRDRAIEKILEDETTSRITKMNQKDFITQDFEQIYKAIDSKLASANRLDNVEGYAIRDAIHEAFKGLERNGARADIIKNLSKNQYAELDRDGVV